MSTRVFFTGGEGINWAQDHLLKQIQIMSPFPRAYDPFSASVIHSVSWQRLQRFPSWLIKNKRIVCHMTHDPAIAQKLSGFQQICNLVNLWIVHSRKAETFFLDAKYPYVYIPFSYDPKQFFPIDKRNEVILALRDEFALPKRKYLIGSFQRDSLGSDLNSPKSEKGADIFLEITNFLYKRNSQIHIILAGPRRHWLRQNLIKQGIPFTFIGYSKNEDDLRINTLPLHIVNRLYNLVDLYLISSRNEGGPQAVIEASACRCKTISTSVGHAADILHPDCIYHDIQQAVKIIEKDIRSGFLEKTVDHNQKNVENNTICAIKPFYMEAYHRLLSFEVGR
jgi:glycosyltransferase involved in cell wall biosynthesis